MDVLSSFSDNGATIDGLVDQFSEFRKTCLRLQSKDYEQSRNQLEMKPHVLVACAFNLHRLMQRKPILRKRGQECLDGIAKALPRTKLPLSLRSQLEEVELDWALPFEGAEVEEPVELAAQPSPDGSQVTGPAPVVALATAVGEEGLESAWRCFRSWSVREGSPVDPILCRQCLENLIKLVELQARYQKRVKEVCENYLARVQCWQEAIAALKVIERLSYSRTKGRGHFAVWSTLPASASAEESSEQVWDLPTALAAVENLYHLVTEYAQTMIEGEGRDSVRKAIAQIQEKMRREWLRQWQHSGLHIVLGGLVSAGKTTFLNAFLCNSLKDFPNDVRIFPTKHDENTAFSTIVQVGTPGSEITVHYETVDESDNAQQHGPTQSVASAAELKSSMDRFLRELKDIDAVVKRMVIRLPFYFDGHVGEELQKSSQELDELRELCASMWMRGCDLSEQTSGEAPEVAGSETLQGFQESPELCIVDTPGLAGVANQNNLTSILEQKQFMYCYFMDLDKDSDAFAKEGFEVLKFLCQDLKREVLGKPQPFPLIIVLTKYEVFRKKWDDPEYRASVRGQSVEAVLQGKIAVLFQKLQDAGITQMPFLAAVNAMRASLPLKDPVDQAKAMAREEMRCLADKMLHLGSRVAVPLQLYCILASLKDGTQKIISEILADERAAGKLEYLTDRAFEQTIEKQKAMFKQLVDEYFDGVQWNPREVHKNRPPDVIRPEECAINNLPDICEAIFSAYEQSFSQGIVKQRPFGPAAEELAKRALTQVLKRIGQDIQRLQHESSKELETSLYKGIPGLKLLRPDRIGWACVWTYGAFGLTTLALGPMIAGVASVFVFAAAFKSLDPDINKVYRYKDLKEVAMQMVCQAIQNACEEIKTHLVNSYNTSAQKLCDDIANFEYATELEKEAVDLLQRLREGEDKAEKLMYGALGNSEWLVGPSGDDTLVSICDHVKSHHHFKRASSRV